MEALSAAEWETPTNCVPWTVRTLAAHVAPQVESYIGNIEPGLRGETVAPESREARTNRMNEIAAWETPAIVNMLKTRTAERLVELGQPPVVLTSPHFVGQTAGAEQLERVYEEYFRRITRAYDPEGALVVPETYD